jgi:CRP-like cAMP-binding protein
LVAGKRLCGPPRFAQIHELRKKACLLPEDRPGGGILIVSRGTVKLSTISGGGRSNAISILRSGDLARAPRRAGGLIATALQASVVCQIEDKVIGEVLHRAPDLAQKLNEKYLGELRRLRTRSVLLGIPSARQRLAAFLVIFTRGAAVGRPAEMMHMPFSRYDIADYLLLTAETVSRAFTELAADGMLVAEAPRRIRMMPGHQGWKEISKEHLAVV